MSMNDVNGFEQLENNHQRNGSQDIGESSEITAISWPAHRLSPVAGHVGLSIGGSLLVWGGSSDFEFLLDDVLIVSHYYRSPGSLFVYPANLNEGVSPSIAEPRTNQTDIWVEWRTKGDIPLKNTGAAVVLCAGHLFVFGGFTDRLTNANLHWKQICYPSLKVPTPRHKLVGWEWNQKVYFFGGYGPLPTSCHQPASILTENGQFLSDEDNSPPVTSWNNQLLCFDPHEFWSTVECAGAIPSPRAASSIVKLANPSRVLLFGGRCRNARLNDVYILDLNSFVWTSICIDGLQPEGRSWMSLTCISPSQVVLYGGLSTEEEPFGDAWVLDTIYWKWHKLPDCLSGRKRLSHLGVEIDGDVFIHGGTADNILQFSPTYCSDVLRLQFRPRSLVCQCLNLLTHQFGDFILDHPSITRQVPFELRQRLQNRSRLIREAHLNAIRTRPIVSHTLSSFKDMLLL